jgi:antitoxin (DNA-binding transcriptional repressor) of toxin-antitoxin stability system
MTIIVDYPSFSSARENLKEVLDATEHGVSVSVARQGNVSVVMPLDRVRDYFFRTVSPRISIFTENSLTVALMVDRPFAAEGVDLDGALTDLILVLREYAADWDTRLKDAPNHQQYWALVQLVKYSTDEQMLEWFDSGGE